MTKLNLWLILSIALAGLPANAAGVAETTMGEAVERHLTDDEPVMQWVQDPDRVDEEEGDTLATRGPAVILFAPAAFRGWRADARGHARWFR